MYKFMLFKFDNDASNILHANSTINSQLKMITNHCYIPNV